MVIDSFEYIEVYVQISANTALQLEIFAIFCGTIRNGIINAKCKSTIALNYDYHEPSFCFGCPCDHPVFHMATTGGLMELYGSVAETDVVRYSQNKEYG